MPELGGLTYKPVLFQLWDTAREAYTWNSDCSLPWWGTAMPGTSEVIHGVEYADLWEIWEQLVRET
jgi:hypothetical protein